MKELAELRCLIEQQHYPEALGLIAEMEAMSREDKVNRIGSFIKILLIHLIKQQAEQRTTRAGDASIANALFEIGKTNRRRKAGGVYVDGEEIREIIEEHYPYALAYAALEAFGGRYPAEELETMFAPDRVMNEALSRILEHTAL
ncbi:MAG: DUF29 domain-containing protein [Chloroflexaceae bacterium]|nr:DUF29 domain-containing protein [Chloroflexaceae bacterium]